MTTARTTLLPGPDEALPDPAPVLKWPGAKRSLLPKIEQHTPPTFGRYYELFAGGASLFWYLAGKGLAAAGAHLNDKNPHVIRLYRELARNPEAVIRELKSLAAHHSEEQFHRVRDAFRAPLFQETEARMAAYFVYLNRTCFNGLYRENAKGEFNVSFGDYESPLICDGPALASASHALQHVTLSCGDYRAVLRNPDTCPRPGDFVYMDPPYVPLTESASFTSYTADGFTIADQRAVRDDALWLKQNGVHVLLSNSDTPIVRELYADGFTLHQVMARRAISSKASTRGAVAELLIT